MLVVCDKCKVIKNIGNFTHNRIKVKEAYFFFCFHKGHPLRVIGDDGGWDLELGRLYENGYVFLKDGEYYKNLDNLF